jgi:hypothetical protein
MNEAQLETWAIHDRINQYLLVDINPAALTARSASKGRSIAEQFRAPAQRPPDVVAISRTRFAWGFEQTRENQFDH